MLDVDLTVPIAILATALVIVMGIRAWASIQERRAAERTASLLAWLEDEDGSIDAPPRGDDPEATENGPSSPDDVAKP